MHGRTVGRGNIILAIKFKGGVFLLADRRVERALVDATSIQRIFQIDERLHIAIEGLTTKGRALVDLAREIAQDNRRTYDEEIPLRALAEQLTLSIQPINRGKTRFIITDGVSIYEANTGGLIFGVHATAIGKGRKEAIVYFSDNYVSRMDEGATCEVLFNALEKAIGEKTDPRMIELKLI